MKPQNKIPDWWGDESFERLEFLTHVDGMDMYLADRYDGAPGSTPDRVLLQVGAHCTKKEAGYVWTYEDDWEVAHVDEWAWSTPAIREFAKAFFALHQ